MFYHDNHYIFDRPEFVYKNISLDVKRVGDETSRFQNTPQNAPAFQKSITWSLSERMCTFLGLPLHDKTITLGTYYHGATGIKPITAVSIQSPHLIASSDNFYHELAVIPIDFVTKSYTVKSINYMPLAINHVRHIQVNICDIIGRRLYFGDSQALISLHFK